MTEEITVETTVNTSVEKTWEYFTKPEHIANWNNASPDWHTPQAVNDLRVSGKFSSRMEAKDGSIGFDFNGVYDEVIPLRCIAYTLEDGRKVRIVFTIQGTQTHLSETFEAETENPIEMQRAGWQAILDNFKRYTETDRI